MSESTNKPNALFWVIGVIALIWNLMGVAAYLFQAFITDEMIAELPKEQQAEFLVEHPSWYTALFALAVFGGALGCILLLIRKKMAFQLFVLSGVCAIVQQVYLFMNVDLSSIVMPVMIIVVCLFLAWYAKDVAKKGILS